MNKINTAILANVDAFLDIGTLAGQMLEHLEQRTRKDGSVFWSRKADAPEWVQAVCLAAHAGMLSDDHRYLFIVNALTALSEGDEDGDTIEADCYTHDLSGWLHSRTDRYSYCDLAVEEGCGFSDTVTLLTYGQWLERREVFQLVKEALEAEVDDRG